MIAPFYDGWVMYSGATVFSQLMQQLHGDDSRRLPFVRMLDVICREFQKLKDWTARHLEQAIVENKWYLSEQELRDVGIRKAEEDFLRRHVEDCGAGWRVEYCSIICESKEGCELGLKFIDRDKPPTR